MRHKRYLVGSILDAALRERSVGLVLLVLER